MSAKIALKLIAPIAVSFELLSVAAPAVFAVEPFAPATEPSFVFPALVVASLTAPTVVRASSVSEVLVITAEPAGKGSVVSCFQQRL